MSLFYRSFAPIAWMTFSCLSFSSISALNQDFKNNFPSENLISAESEESQDSLLPTALSLINGQNYVHENANYHLVAFSDTGDVVQLQDASKWSVYQRQRDTVLRWVQSDYIYIKPSASCCSSYKYVLHNLTTEEAVEVNLIKPPLPMGAYTFLIVNIDYALGWVQLSDNTIWEIDPYDKNFPYWKIGQAVLVGVNNKWRTATKSHILINVEMYGQPYSQASYYGYTVGE